MGHAEYDASDSANLEFACRELQRGDLLAAEARGERILSEIVPLPANELSELRDQLMDRVYQDREPANTGEPVELNNCPEGTIVLYEYGGDSRCEPIERAN